jgi:hypothetical protein
MKLRLFTLFAFVFIPFIIFSANFNVSSIAELRTALSTASTNGENDSITIQNDAYSVTSEISYDISDSRSLVIAGDGVVELNGASSHRIMRITSNGALRFRNLAFTFGRSTTTGGGLLTEADDDAILISGCSFSHCYAGEMGGGLNAISNSGNITIEDSYFIRCTGRFNAGGLNAGTVSGNITIRGSTFERDTVLTHIDPYHMKAEMAGHSSFTPNQAMPLFRTMSSLIVFVPMTEQEPFFILWMPE